MGCNNTILSFSLKILFKQMPTNWPLWIPKTWRIKNQAYFVMCWVVAREYNMFNYKCICITLITPCLFVCLCSVVNLSLFECSNCYFYKLKNCVQRKNIFWPFWHQNRLSGYYDTTNTTKQYPNILRCLRCIAYKHQPNSTQLNSTQPQPNPIQFNRTNISTTVYRICVFNWVGCRSLMNVKYCSRSARISRSGTNLIVECFTCLRCSTLAQTVL